MCAMSNVYCCDCLEAMRQMPDKCFDLAVVDPPYGIEKAFNGPKRIAKYGQLVTVNDQKPTAEYFTQLFRVSKNQIVFGYNHLSDMLPPTKEFLFWYKHQPVDTYSDGELAWTSFQKTAKCFDYPFFGAIGSDKDGRIHPTKKPIALYRWIYQLYTKKGYKLLDTHAGSQSSRIAAFDAGLDYVGFEIDPTYFKLGEERFAAHTAQISLFEEGE